MRDVRDFGVELVPGEGLTYHTRENLDTYFWYAWDTSHASDAKKPCFSYPHYISAYFFAENPHFLAEKNRIFYGFYVWGGGEY